MREHLAGATLASNTGNNGKSVACDRTRAYESEFAQNQQVVIVTSRLSFHGRGRVFANNIEKAFDVLRKNTIDNSRSQQ
jgi:hypothetical protein